MKKGLKALLKTSIAIATAICIVFTSMDSRFLARAEENQAECASYETVVNTIKSMIHGQTNKEAAENLMRSLSEDEICQIVDIYNNHVNIDDQYNTVCSLLEARDFDSMISYIKNNITLSEFDVLLSIYINHAADINSFIEKYKSSTEEDIIETETEESTENNEETETEESTENNEETETEESTENNEEPDQTGEYTETEVEVDSTEENNTEETEETEQNETETTEEEAETEEIILVQTELTEAVNGTTISISGNLPEDTELVVTELEDDKVIKNSIEETLNGLATVTVYKSFDISLISKEEEYEPESDNNSVVVTIQCEDSIEDNLTVFHIDDNNTTTEISSTINAETNIVEFTTESFSIYTIASVTYDTEVGVEYTNEYGTGYYYADTKTLLVTAGSSTGSASSYPWYEQKDNIEKVVITGDVTTIPNYVFKGYSKIKSVIMEDGITYIGEYAFDDCSSLTEVILPDTVTTLGIFAFRNCSSLSHIVVPEACKTMSAGGYITFQNCTSLTTASPISSNKGTGYEYGWTDQIPARAFDSLTNLAEIEFIDGITYIGEYAFGNCSSLTEIILPTDLQTIGFRSFQYCNSLTTITAYENISSIGTNGFYVSSSINTTVITDNKIVKNYNWSGDKRNVTFQRLTPITDLDVTISIDALKFNIDYLGTFTSEDSIIKNNNDVAISVNIVNIEKEGYAPDIVESSLHSDWEGVDGTEEIALMINGEELSKVFNNSNNDTSKYISLGTIEKYNENEIIIQDSVEYGTSYGTAHGNVTTGSNFGYVGNGADNYITYDLTSSYNSTYIMTIKYGYGSSSYVNIDINGEFVSKFQPGQFSGTGDIEVALKAGNNTIKIYNDEQYGIDIYSLTFVEVNNNPKTTYDTSYGTAYGAVTNGSYFGYIGNGADNYVEYNIPDIEAGTYSITINYTYGNGRYMNIDVNGNNVGQVQANDRSGSVKLASVVEFMDGSNIIKLYNNSSYACDISGITLQKVDGHKGAAASSNSMIMNLTAKYGDFSSIYDELIMKYNMTLLFESQEE